MPYAVKNGSLSRCLWGQGLVESEGFFLIAKDAAITSAGLGLMDLIGGREFAAYRFRFSVVALSFFIVLF